MDLIISVISVLPNINLWSNNQRYATNKYIFNCFFQLYIKNLTLICEVYQNKFRDTKPRRILWGPFIPAQNTNTIPNTNSIFVLEQGLGMVGGRFGSVHNTFPSNGFIFQPLARISFVQQIFIVIVHTFQGQEGVGLRGKRILPHNWNNHYSNNNWDNQIYAAALFIQ